jgi:hypothetical protein
MCGTVGKGNFLGRVGGCLMVAHVIIQMNYQVNYNEQYCQVQVRNKKIKGKVILLALPEGMKGEWRYSSTFKKVKDKFKILYSD